MAGLDLARLLAAAQHCPTPVRFMGGDRDLVVRNGRHGRLLAALMPKADYVGLPGLGHMIHHFAPERVADAVVDLQHRGRAGNRSEYPDGA